MTLAQFLRFHGDKHRGPRLDGSVAPEDELFTISFKVAVTTERDNETFPITFVRQWTITIGDTACKHLVVRAYLVPAPEEQRTSSGNLSTEPTSGLDESPHTIATIAAFKPILKQRKQLETSKPLTNYCNLAYSTSLAALIITSPASDVPLESLLNGTSSATWTLDTKASATMRCPHPDHGKMGAFFGGSAMPLRVEIITQ